MSDFHVPCCDRLVLAKSWRVDEMVSLEVGRDDDSEVFEVPLRHLRNTSDYFNDRSAHFLLSAIMSLWNHLPYYHKISTKGKYIDTLQPVRNGQVLQPA